MNNQNGSGSLHLQHDSKASVRGTGLTHPKSQQSGIILADPNPELCSLCDGLGNPVVDVTVKLENDKVVFLLTAGVCYISETERKHIQCVTVTNKVRAFTQYKWLNVRVHYERNEAKGTIRCANLIQLDLFSSEASTYTKAASSLICR